MGAANTKIEEDKALVLCRERRRFVGQAIDQRCSLAAAHVSYIHSLRNVGIAFKNFLDPEDCTGSIESATTEPLAAQDRSVSHLPNTSPSLSHVDTAQPISPNLSPFSTDRCHVNYMIAGKTPCMTVEEKPPTSSTTTLHISQSDEISSFEPTVPPRQQPWDYFDHHPADNQPSFPNVRGFNHGFDNADEIICLKKEESITDLKGNRTSTNEKNDLDSEDDFDQTSNEPTVQIFTNRIMVAEHQLKRDDIEDVDSESKCQTRDYMKSINGISETDETPEMTPSKVVPSPTNGRTDGSNLSSKGEEGRYFSCMKELDDLFLKASESGSEVTRMLEADKARFRPLFPQGKAHRSEASAFLTSCFTCCKAETPHPQATDEVKYLTWDRSASLLSSSSANFFDTTAKDATENLNGNLFSSTCMMNSGSHSSTLDRLYAWERKLYDEVKASGVIRREYDVKCRVLRHKESTKESWGTTDKTRAAVKDLHSRIRVAIHRIDSISKKIEEIRDKELQPQLEELIEGLTRMWRMMLHYHSHQLRIISSIPNSSSSIKISIRPESEDNARVLETELKSLCSNFTHWISAHKSYLKAIDSWLRKCVLEQKQNKSSRRRQQPFVDRYVAPPIFVTCKAWLLVLSKLPTDQVSTAMKDLATVTAHFLPHQEKGHGASKISFSVNAAQSDELEGLIRRSSSHANWNLKCDNLRSALKEFLDKLKSFAESSVSEYSHLPDSINSARTAYKEK